MTSRLIDLSHVITAGMRTYPGLPVPIIEDHPSREHGFTFTAVPPKIEGAGTFTVRAFATLPA